MPWHVEKTEQCPASKPWGVIKDADGSSVGCHETETQAIAQLVVLKQVEASGRPYLEKLWDDEMQAVLLAAETDFELIQVRLNQSREVYTLMLANTAERRQVGLSFRPQLPEGIDGMLFMYANEESLRAFTAEYTQMDLDLFGFDRSGQLTAQKVLPAGAPGPYMVPKSQFVVETNKNITVEFLELV